MESNRVIAGTIGLFIVICLVGAVLAPMINDWATGERITNEGAGWLRMDYTEVTESSNYSMAVSLAGGTITVTDTNSATQSGADDTIAYASSTLAIWTDSGTIQILGTDPDGNPYHATASASVNVRYNIVLGQIIKIDGSNDAITFATPTWAYLPLTNGNYAFFDNGTSVQTEEGKPFVAVGGGFAGVYAYNNLMAIPGVPLQLQTTQDADGLLNGAYWAEPQQDQRQLIPITLDPLDPATRTDDPGSSIRSVPTPTYTDGVWGYDLTTVGGVQKAVIVSYSGTGGDIVVPASVGGYDVYRVGKDPATTAFGSKYIVDNANLSANSTLTISNGIVEIGTGAFRNCAALTGSLVIPDSVTSIGNYAFYGCSGFTGSLDISESVTYIGSNAFSRCSGLNGTISIPNTITTIEGNTFSSCGNLTGSVIIPDSVTSIGSNAFSGDSSLNGALVVPDSVTSIADYAFSGCGFTTVIILSNATPSDNTSFAMSTPTEILDLSDTIDYSVNRYGLPAAADVSDSIGDALGYISFTEIGSDPLVPAGAAAVMLAIPVVILASLIVVAATMFIRRE